MTRNVAIKLNAKLNGYVAFYIKHQGAVSN